MIAAGKGSIIEKYIGFDIRWGSDSYDLDLSIAFLFITIVVGIGRTR